MVSSGSFQVTRDNLSFVSKSDPHKMLEIAKFCGISPNFFFFWLFLKHFSTEIVLASTKVGYQCKKTRIGVKKLPFWPFLAWLGRESQKF